ncbi:hypothetical protein GA0115233_103712 [Streptomyces sp. DI166]|uniref:hypothetical protein n=1 Tax=Streptomyces sp. DI166 TaxID=1839783 RepID=UPI0007F4804C|nr:hypothetical protein [Streptomyces sp. DI166]SBT91904.1 hypothetical protein GA0115233_103712 [Streptomyces sp. DI166]
MPDRSLRLLPLPPQPVQGGERHGVLLRERPSSPPDAPSGGADGDERDDKPTDAAPTDDNPFAPPPEGTPDRPWQPRRPASGDGSGNSGEGGQGSPWGSQWSDRQPGRSPGGFGERPRPEGGQGNSGGPGSGMRWDPTDPAQRRARYALLCGMWAFFFALFSWPYVALLLGALAMYWSISALRAKPRTPDPDSPAPAPSGRPQTTAAVTGLVTASLALALVAAGFGAKLVYSDYYTCKSDALTNEAKKGCDDLLPEQLRGVLGNDG